LPNGRNRRRLYLRHPLNRQGSASKLAESAMADVFISYQRSDRPKALALAQLIEGFGFSVWWDADLLPGQTYEPVIAEFIRTSGAALVIWSPQSIKSGWVKDEARRAMDLQKLIPVSLGGAKPPMGFGELQICDLSVWDETRNVELLDPVLTSIEGLVGRPRAKFRADALATVVPESNKPMQERRRAIALSRWKEDFLWPFSYVVVLFLLVSFAAYYVHVSNFGLELVKLAHVYTGMIILGGGVFVFLLFRIAARASTRQERWACAEAAKKLVMFVWWPAALLQPFIGLGMMYAGNNFAWQDVQIYTWLIVSGGLYAVALGFWFAGFRSAWDAARADADLGGLAMLQMLKFNRDLLLGVALACTIGVYSLMVYKPWGLFFPS
jgi:hypothetical protein